MPRPQIEASSTFVVSFSSFLSKSTKANPPTNASLRFGLIRSRHQRCGLRIRNTSLHKRVLAERQLSKCEVYGIKLVGPNYYTAKTIDIHTWWWCICCPVSGSISKIHHVHTFVRKDEKKRNVPFNSIQSSIR